MTQKAQINMLRNELMALCYALLRENNLTRSAFKIEVLEIHQRLKEATAIRATKHKPAIDSNLVYPGKDPDFVFPEEN